MGGLAMCTKDSTITCAKDAYENLFEAAPGEKFTYTESSFYVLAAVAMEITGLSNVDSVFQELIARPLEMEGCSFSLWSLEKTDPGGGLKCSAEEYGKFMRAVFGQTLVSKKLHEEAERFQTERASNMPIWQPLAGEMQILTASSFTPWARRDFIHTYGVKAVSRIGAFLQLKVLVLALPSLASS